MSEQNGNLIDTIKTLLQWKKTILVFTAVTAIGSIILSLAMPNYYSSTTVFYPASTDLFMADKLFGTASESSKYYGSPEDLDRVLTIAQSTELYDHLIKKFDLCKRYGIDTTSPKSHYKVYEVLMSLYSAKKTKFEAVELSVEDIEPLQAARMANEAREKIASMVEDVVHRGQANIAKTMFNEIQQKQHLLDSVNVSLKQMRSKYGIYNTETQSTILTNLLAIADAKLARTRAQVQALEKDPTANRDSISMLRSLVKGYESEAHQLSGTSLNTFNQGMGSVDIMSQIHFEERRQLSGDIVKYDRLCSAMRAKISAVHIIEAAKTPLIKSRPKRLVLVLAATLIAFVLSIFAVLLINAYRAVNWKEQ